MHMLFTCGKSQFTLQHNTYLFIKRTHMIDYDVSNGFRFGITKLRIVNTESGESTIQRSYMYIVK